MVVCTHQRLTALQETLPLDTSISRFPVGDVETPFISCTVLVSRRVFDRANFDPSYRANA
jgi:hypothetical protein